MSSEAVKSSAPFDRPQESVENRLGGNSRDLLAQLLEELKSDTKKNPNFLVESTNALFTKFLEEMRAENQLNEKLVEILIAAVFLVRTALKECHATEVLLIDGVPFNTFSQTDEKAALLSFLKAGKHISFGILVEHTTTAPRIRWGTDTSTTSGERASAEDLVLIHRDLRFMRAILSRNTSSGSACVPLSYAYLQILKNNTTDVAQQQAVIDRILNIWREKHGGGFVQPAALMDFDGSRVHVLTRVPNTNTLVNVSEFQQINALISYFTAHRNTRFDAYASEYFLLDREIGERAMLISTAGSLRGRVVHADRTNPHWRGQRVPKPGEVVQTAGEHALLVVDFKEVTENTYEFYMIDPMTGSVLAVPMQELERVIREPREDIDQRHRVQTGPLLY